MPIAPSLPDALLQVLQQYRPAIAAFPWGVVDSTVPAMSALKRKYTGQVVSPLTGFDSGTRYTYTYNIFVM
jgi:hypothetical protein